MEQKVIGKNIAKFRKELGLKIVVWDHTLEQGGKVRAKELATDYSHTRPNGESYRKAWTSYITHKDFTGSIGPAAVYGENINRGFTNIPDWWSTINAFKNSKGHRGLMTMGFKDDVDQNEGSVFMGDSTDEGIYMFTGKKGDICRNTGSICCVSYQKNKDSSIYYNYSIGSINKVYTVNGKLFEGFKGDLLRDGKYVFGQLVPRHEIYPGYIYDTDEDVSIEDTTVTEEETTTLSEEETSINTN